MLRKTRGFVIIFFVFSIVLFGGYRIWRYTSADRTLPVIEMDTDTVTVPVDGGDEAILEGVTATDEKDGDITDSLFIESRTNFVEKGRFRVTITVSDKDNHVTKAEREVVYSDYTSPKFSLSGPLKFLTARENQDDLDIASGLSAYDVVDGNISNNIKISGDYSLLSNTPGEYPMEFAVTNSMGETAKLPVTVTIYSAADERGLPEITLKEYLINTPVGNGADVAALIDQIEYHNDVYRRADDGNFYTGDYDEEGNPVMIPGDAIRIDTQVDWNTPGVYDVKITYSDDEAGLSNYARCYIVVY